MFMDPIISGTPTNVCSLYKFMELIYEEDKREMS